MSAMEQERGSFLPLKKVETMQLIYKCMSATAQLVTSELTPALEASVCRVVALQVRRSCQRVRQLWSAWRQMALRKLRAQLSREAAATRPLGALDWALVDLLLLYDANVLAEIRYKLMQQEVLQATFQLVHLFDLEPDEGAAAPARWARAAAWHRRCRGGVMQLSAVALQRCWHELKADTRRRARAAADEVRPLLLPIHRAVAARYPHVVNSSERLSWRQLVATGKVAGPTPAPNAAPARRPREHVTEGINNKLKKKDLSIKSLDHKNEHNSSYKTPIQKASYNTTKTETTKYVHRKNNFDKINDTATEGQTEKDVGAMRDVDLCGVDAILIYERDAITVLDVQIDKDDTEKAKHDNDKVNVDKKIIKHRKELTTKTKDNSVQNNKNENDKNNLINVNDIKIEEVLVVDSDEEENGMSEECADEIENVINNANYQDIVIAKYLGISKLSSIDPKLLMRPTVSLRRVDNPPTPSPHETSENSYKTFYEKNKEFINQCRPCEVRVRRTDGVRGRRVRLPDMERVRRNNKRMLTAEVAPLVAEPPRAAGQHAPARAKRPRTTPADNPPSDSTTSEKPREPPPLPQTPASSEKILKCHQYSAPVPIPEWRLKSYEKYLLRVSQNTLKNLQKDDVPVHFSSKSLPYTHNLWYTKPRKSQKVIKKISPQIKNVSHKKHKKTSIEDEQPGLYRLISLHYKQSPLPTTQVANTASAGNQPYSKTSLRNSLLDHASASWIPTGSIYSEDHLIIDRTLQTSPEPSTPTPPTPKTEPESRPASPNPGSLEPLPEPSTSIPRAPELITPKLEPKSRTPSPVALKSPLEPFTPIIPKIEPTSPALPKPNAPTLSLEPSAPLLNDQTLILNATYTTYAKKTTRAQMKPRISELARYGNKPVILNAALNAPEPLTPVLRVDADEAEIGKLEHSLLVPT